MKSPLAWFTLTAFFTLTAVIPNPSRAQTVRQPPDVRAEADQVLARQAMARRLLDAAIARADSISKVLTTLKQESQALAQRLAKLPEGDEGKRLASTLDVLSAEDLGDLLDTPAVDLDLLAVHQKHAEALLADLKKQRQNDVPGSRPPDEIVGELIELLKWANAQRAKVRQQGEWIDLQLLTVAKDFDAARAPTLQQRLREFRRMESAEKQEARRLGREQAKAEGLAKLTEIERIIELERRLQEADLAKQKASAKRAKAKTASDKELADLNAKLAKVNAELARQKARTEAELLEGKDAAALIVRRAEAARPRVREVLKPFISPGYFQPPHNMSIDAGPMSLSGIRQFGALERTEKGLDLLIRIAMTSEDKVRPRWGFKEPVRRMPKDQVEFVNEAQRYLIEYGDILVEQGVLAKADDGQFSFTHGCLLVLPCRGGAKSGMLSSWFLEILEVLFGIDKWLTPN
jgi:hypothetical protein